MAFLTSVGCCMNFPKKCNYKQSYSLPLVSGIQDNLVHPPKKKNKKKKFSCTKSYPKDIFIIIHP